MGIQSDLNNDELTAQIQRIMETHYDLGKLTRIKEIFGGFCNKSYAVWMSRDDTQKKLFLRLYNPAVVESEIRFEHALVSHLRRKGFELAAAVIPG